MSILPSQVPFQTSSLFENLRGTPPAACASASASSECSELLQSLKSGEGHRKPSMNELIGSRPESMVPGHVGRGKTSQFYLKEKQCGSMPHLFDSKCAQNQPVPIKSGEHSSLDHLADISSHKSEHERAHGEHC